MLIGFITFCQASRTKKKQQTSITLAIELLEWPQTINVLSHEICSIYLPGHDCFPDELQFGLVFIQ